MVKREHFSAAICPISRALDHIGDRWTLLIIRDAFDGKARFTEFQSSLGIARNILTDRLRSLVENDIMYTAPTKSGSAYQEYRLTYRGKKLFPLMVALRQWGEEFLYSANEHHSLLIDLETGEELPIMQPINMSGRFVDPDRVLVVE
ncbi:transcriptional regulator [Saccharibacter sp. 17.LH.SD]|uniref:winged helix-turn-helix transcriptional regulator n=1 Tax=Saccharibacter sp. 17.LH.SD TaxID=2689393 RepID=UPI00136BF92E|nr:helix-turn-helix domain-containing protein [Saccharibacter sp. 17.LH.SD]MXV44357.1 transcriptional regulator [Saccharibacter sp. 17.LH.SD]